MPGEHILLVITKNRAGPEALAYALRKSAEKGGRLTVALVVLEHKAEELHEHLANQGFLGHGVSGKLREEILQEDEAVGREVLDRILSRAAEQGIQAEKVILRGPLVKAVPRWARKHRVDRIVITRADRGSLWRSFFGSEVNELLREPRVQVEVFKPKRRRWWFR